MSLRIRSLAILAVTALAAYLLAGCVIIDMNHPTIAGDGETFDVTFSTEVEDLTDYPPIYFIIGVMMPDNFDWVAGTWDLVGGGNGNMVETDEATTGIDLATTYDTHPVPAGYSWYQFRTDGTIDPTGGGGTYVTDYLFRFRAHLARTGEDYTMSYASGFVYADYSAYAMGAEEDQSWDNPITVGYAGIDTVSVGEIKVNFH
jgi:hypothetical protein